MQEAVDTAQIYEGSVLGQILDGSGEDGAFVDHAKRNVLAGIDLFLHRQLSRNDRVATLAVEFDELDGNVLAYELIHVADGPGVDLGAWHEGSDADVYR